MPWIAVPFVPSICARTPSLSGDSPASAAICADTLAHTVFYIPDVLPMLPDLGSTSLYSSLWLRSAYSVADCFTYCVLNSRSQFICSAYSINFNDFTIIHDLNDEVAVIFARLHCIGSLLCNQFNSFACSLVPLQQSIHHVLIRLWYTVPHLPDPSSSAS